MEKRLCFSYLRFSRAEQAHGNSTKRQTELREAYCHRHNLVLDDSRRYEDRGVSAFHGKNAVEGHLAQFLDLVNTGQIPPGSVLLIESIDRLSRDHIRPARDRLESILEAGIEVHTLQPERVYNRESLTDFYALMGMLFEFSRSHEYSAQLGKRLSAAWASKRERAKSHRTPLSKRPPAWLEVVDGEYRVIPERGQSVALIYKLCTDGLGVNLITQELIHRQVPPFTETTSAGKTITEKWTEPFVAKILLGEAAIGHHQPIRIDPQTRKKVPTEKILNLYPAVISDTLNAQAKVAMRQRRLRGGRVDLDGQVHPFSGLLRTHAGAPLRVFYRYVGRKNPVMTPFLKDLSNGNSYPLPNFEVLMLAWMTTMDRKPEPVHKPSDEITALQDKLAQLDHNIQTLTDQINPGEPFESFLKLLATAERDRKATADRLDQLRSITPVGQGLTSLGTIIERLGPMNPDHLLQRPRDVNLELRAALRRIVKGIEVTIGQEHRFWKKKSLRVRTTFKDGVKVEFTYRPG